MPTMERLLQMKKQARNTNMKLRGLQNTMEERMESRLKKAVENLETSKRMTELLKEQKENLEK